MSRVFVIVVVLGASSTARATPWDPPCREAFESARSTFARVEPAFVAATLKDLIPNATTGSEWLAIRVETADRSYLADLVTLDPGATNVTGWKPGGPPEPGKLSLARSGGGVVVHLVARAPEKQRRAFEAAFRPALDTCIRARPPIAAAPGKPWNEAWDLDGDGELDRIEVAFTSGAHCCYRLTIHLGPETKPIALPFELDGGYVGGLDLSRPERFTIRALPGETPELVAEVDTYNGEPNRPAAWKKRHRVRTNHVAISFAGGTLRIRDVPRPARP